MSVASKTTGTAGSMRAIGLAGVAVNLVLAAILSGIAGRPGSFPNPPEPIPRGLALGVLYALPAVIGAVGAMHERRSLLAAAAVLCAIGSLLAFSGVTLIFLVPAVVLAAATGAGAPPSAKRRVGWRAVVALTLVAVAVVIATLRLGVFVLPALALLVLGLGIGHGTQRSRPSRPMTSRLVEVAAAVLIVVLLVGAGVTLLSMTETRCWTAERGPTGVVYRDVPAGEHQTIHLGPGNLAGGCESGALTGSGAAIASVLGLAAVGLALVTGGPGEQSIPPTLRRRQHAAREGSAQGETLNRGAKE